MPLGHLISGASRVTQLTAFGVLLGVVAGIAASLDIIGLTTTELGAMMEESSKNFG
jgi:hypothetical protein